VCSFLSACGGGSATAPPPPADAGDDARPDAAGGDAALDGGGSDQARVMAAALQGAWHAETASGDGGAPMVLRRRFVDQTYYELWHSADLICAESGGFTVVDGKVTFTPDRHLGFPACAFAVAHVEEAEAVDGGITFVRDGTSTRYMPIAPVPKLFATLEVHNGDFASDATLPGSNPFAKADAFCNASLVKPDGLSYKALLVDGIHRAAVPAIDWVLRPNTTYYQPNGVVNSFRTGADGLTNPFPNNPTLENGGGDVTYETDFRAVYARVLDNWLGANSVSVLGGDYRKPSLTFI